MASGSEVNLALQTACAFRKEGILANIVSVPCFDLLLEQSEDYINKIIDPKQEFMQLKQTRALEYYKYADVVFGMDSLELVVLLISF